MAYYQLEIDVPPDSREHLIAFLSMKGSLGFMEDDARLTAYFAGTADIQSLLRELEIGNVLLNKAGLNPGVNVSVALLPDQDWNESWKKGFVPLDVGDHFTILPPWEKKREGRINLIIDPGMAFGTGHHETTRSCLVLMEKYDGRIAKDRFLDLGTGTGLLAIAASKLGYREILAVDTDPLATEATGMNVKLNGADNVEIREGSISEAAGDFDCIAANIISGVLIDLAPALAARIRPSGIAILSGILSEQVDEVIAAMNEAELRLREELPDDKWRSLVVSH